MAEAVSDTVQQKVLEIIAAKAHVPVESVGPETSLESLGIDSLDMTEIVFELEEAFNIQIPDTADVSDRLHALTTAGSAVALVKTLLP